MSDNEKIFADPAVVTDIIEPIEYVWDPDSMDPAEKLRQKASAEGYRFFFDDLILVRRYGNRNVVSAYRAHDVTGISDEADEMIKRHNCVFRDDHPVGSGYSLCLIPLGDTKASGSAINRAEKRLDYLFGDSSSRLGNIYFDRRRVADIASFCGCGTDILSFISSGSAAVDLDTLFCSGAITVLALMYRRIGLRRGFNLKTDIIDFTVYLSFNALICENGDSVSDDEFIGSIPEIEILNASANSRGIPLNVSVIHDEKCGGARRLAVRFCAKNDPYRQKDTFTARDRAERAERIRRVKQVMDEFPFDTKGKY